MDNLSPPDKFISVDWPSVFTGTGVKIRASELIPGCIPYPDFFTGVLRSSFFSSIFASPLLLGFSMVLFTTCFLASDVTEVGDPPYLSSCTSGGHCSDSLSWPLQVFLLEVTRLVCLLVHTGYKDERTTLTLDLGEYLANAGLSGTWVLLLLNGVYLVFPGVDEASIFYITCKIKIVNMFIH